MRYILTIIVALLLSGCDAFKGNMSGEEMSAKVEECASKGYGFNEFIRPFQSRATVRVECCHPSMTGCNISAIKDR